MPIFKVTVEVVETHATYVEAVDEAAALAIPKQEDWYSSDIPEPVTRTVQAQRVSSIHAVPKEWRDELPWGHGDKTIRQALRKKA